MGVDRDKVLPRVIDKACGMKTAEPLRARVGADLDGQVLEIGFGSGLKTSHYPPAVTAVAAIEPSDLAWRLAGDRLSAWTLCTIPDVTVARAEIRRVLKPGDTLHFVRARPGARQQRAALAAPPRAPPGAPLRRLPPHRPITHLLADAGLTIRDLDVSYDDGAHKVLAADSLGVAECTHIN